jgi:hypothetical protein
MRSRAEEYRRRGIEAQQRAARATDLSIKQTFTDIANGWFALAEQAEWLERGAPNQRSE